MKEQREKPAHPAETLLSASEIGKRFFFFFFFSLSLSLSSFLGECEREESEKEEYISCASRRTTISPSPSPREREREKEKYLDDTANLTLHAVEEKVRVRRGERQTLVSFLRHVNISSFVLGKCEIG